MGEHLLYSLELSKPTSSGVARQLDTFFCFAKRKYPKKRRPQSAIPSGFPALLTGSGFLINSHDPLRVHVLKHIRQNSLTRLRYSVAEQGMEKQNAKPQTREAGIARLTQEKQSCAQRTQNRFTAFELPSPVRRRVAEGGQEQSDEYV